MYVCLDIKWQNRSGMTCMVCCTLHVGQSYQHLAEKWVPWSDMFWYIIVHDNIVHNTVHDNIDLNCKGCYIVYDINCQTSKLRSAFSIRQYRKV